MTRKGQWPLWSRSFNWRWLLWGVLLAVFVAGGIYSGRLFYSTVRDLVAHAQLGAPATPIAEDGPVQTQSPPDIEQERVNILVLGTDRRTGEQGPSHTDTMIVLTVDPGNQTAGMLSIPRDLWVSIPGHSENRINTAHFLGEVDGNPGGGAALAKTTVQYALGIPIHYYVRVNFEGFERFIDAIEGITIDVQEAIYDPKYPDGNYGLMIVDIPVGVQHMDGKTALQYARARHGGSDFARARRQQEVIKAVRDKVLSLDIPLTKIPEILRIVGGSVQTDLTLSDMYALAKVARTIDAENIKSVVIDESMTTPQLTPDGADVLIPDRARIREALDMLFAGPSLTAQAGLSESELVAQEAARIEVQNGTPTEGLAQRTSEYLGGLGYTVVSFCNADRSDYASNVIIVYSEKPNTVNSLVARFGIAPENVRQGVDAHSEVDVRVVLGRDYAEPSTM